MVNNDQTIVLEAIPCKKSEWFIRRGMSWWNDLEGYALRCDNDTFQWVGKGHWDMIVSQAIEGQPIVVHELLNMKEDFILRDKIEWFSISAEEQQILTNKFWLGVD